MLFTKEEIATLFDATVSDGKKGHTTAEKSQCDYSVGAAGNRPQGTLVVIVVFVGAKTVYDFKKRDSVYEPIADFPNAVFNPSRSIVEVLAGDVLLSVQGIFMPEELVPVPAHLRDVRSELVGLAKLAMKRL